MKRQPIYADPADLKKKNQDDQGTKPPHLGLTGVGSTPQPVQQPQQQPGQAIPMTKEDIIEIAKEAYEEGLSDAKKQQSPVAAQGQQAQAPAQQKQEEQPKQEEQQQAQPQKQQAEQPQQEASQPQAQQQEEQPKQEQSPQQQTASHADQPHNEMQGKEERQQASMRVKPGQSPQEAKKAMKDKMPSNDKRGQTSGGKQQSSGQEGEKPQERLETIVERNNYVLFEAKSIWPIDFFPDTILIDMTKISIIHKTFYATEHVTAIPLQSIADIFLQTTFFSAALTIKYLLRTDRPGIIEPVETKILALHRNEAIIAKNIIRGLILANEENIDLTKIKIEDLRGKLEELGATKTGI